MASGQEIRISIVSALNAAGIEATKRQVDQMSKSVGASFADMAKANKTHWADIKAAWDMGVGAITKVAGFIQDAIKKAFDAEYALTNFKTLLGSVDAAKEHVADLKKFASQTPLTFGDLSQASKTLLAFGVSVENVVPSLRVLGDISLGNAEKFQSLALAFGKVESQGKLTGVELKQMVLAGFNPLQEIARKTGADMGELKDQMEAGEISFELVEAAMRSATGEGGRFNNALKDASTTGNGLVSTLQDNWNMAIAAFGNAFVNARKEGLEKLIAKLQELNQNGTIDIWAAKIGAALESVGEKAKTVMGWMSKLVELYQSIQDTGKAAGAAVGSAVGTLMEGGSIKEAMNNAAEEFAKVAVETEEVRAEEKAMEEKIRERATAEKEAAESAKTTVEKNEKSLEEIYTARKQLADAEKEEAEREKERAEGNKLWAEVWKEELGDAMREESTARREAAKAEQELKTAEEKLKEAIKEYEKNLYQNLIDEQIEKSKNADNGRTMTNYWGDLMKQVPMITAATKEQAIRQGIANGTIRSVDDATKIGNQVARESAKQLSKASNIAGREAQRAARLEKMSQKAMSKVDKEWLKRYKQIEAAKKAQREAVKKREQEVKEAKQKLQEAQKKQEESFKDIKEINTKLKSLGLK